MPWNRPTLNQIIDRIDRDIESRVLGKVAILQKAMLWILSRVFAGAVHIAYGYIEEIAKQIMPDQATGDWLKRHAEIWGVKVKAASYSSGYIVFLGTEGTIIPENTEVRSLEGNEYITLVNGTIINGLAKIPSQAKLFGISSNFSDSKTLSLIEAITFIESDCYAGLLKINYTNILFGPFQVGQPLYDSSSLAEGYIVEVSSSNSLMVAVKSGEFLTGNFINNGLGTLAEITGNPLITESFTGGTDQETDESLQSRILLRIQQSPSSGSKTDYERWARDTVSEHGIVNDAWTFPELPSPGYATIVIKGEGEDPTPSASLIADVLESVNFLKPVTANIIVVGVIDIKISMHIKLPATQNTVDIQNSIISIMKDLFESEAVPGGIMYISQIRNAISSAGVSNYVIDTITSNIALTPPANPNQDLIFTGFQYGTVGSLTFGVI